MEELLTLRELLIEGNISEALDLVEEMTEMSKDNKINRVSSHAKVLLVHLIKRTVEQPTTRSWDLSIVNAVNEIQKTNRRRKAEGTYLTASELQEAVNEAYAIALKFAAVEAVEMTSLIQQEAIVQEAIALIEEPLV